MPRATVLATTSQHLQLDQATRTRRSSQRHEIIQYEGAGHEEEKIPRDQLQNGRT
jgi:hypothetical protein